jgi:hypothetical protein
MLGFWLFAFAVQTPAASVIRWNETFRESYFSSADAAPISFQIRTPPKDETLRRYPLLVALKGSLRARPSKRFPFFEVRPSRGNVWGYRAMSAFDTMQVVAHMKENYPVDADRIYLVGSSAGASGAMHLASQYPDQFAAVLPLVAAGNDYPIANFLNLPVAIHHGAKDWTSAICDARVQFQKLKRSGCPVILREYPNAGHSIPLPHEPILEWLFAQRRASWPDRVTHQCDTPELGRSYWLAIDGFADPHQPASIDATIDSDQGIVRIAVTNVNALSLHRPGLTSAIDTIRLGNESLPIPRDQQTIRISLVRGRWEFGAQPVPARRAYRAGAAANLLQGEPLLVVYGTDSASPARIAGLRAAAQKISGCGGPHYAALHSRFPVVSDTALTAKQAARHNLILIGRPDENTVTRRLMPELPFAIREDRLTVGSRPSLPVGDRVLSLLHPNPEHPQRLIYVVAPFVDAVAFADVAQKHLVGSDGFDRGSQGDLVLQDLKQRIARQMQFDSAWKWSPVKADSDRPLPAEFRDRAGFAGVLLKTMHQQSGADHSLWYGPADRGMWGADFNFLKRYDPAHCTAADLSIERRQVETMTGSVTGAELKQIWNRWGIRRELISVPPIDAASINGSTTYRLHIPMDLYIKLGQRKRNLVDPKPGPLISITEVVSELFLR